MLHGGGPQLAFLRRPLLLELRAALLGGRQFDAMFGQRFGGLAMRGGVTVESLLPLGDRRLHLVDGGLARGDAGVQQRPTGR